MPEKRVWSIVDPDGTEHGSFTGSGPWVAIRKIASHSNGTKENPVEVKIREAGTQTVRVYKVWREKTDKQYKPPWLKDGYLSYEGHWKYIRVEHLTTPHHSPLLKQEREERERLAAQGSSENAAPQ